MKVYVTIGTTNGHIEKEFDIPDDEFATYIGLEIDNKNQDEEDKSPRLTVMRMPFHNHGIRIHTICRLGTDDTYTAEL